VIIYWLTPSLYFCIIIKYNRRAMVVWFNKDFIIYQWYFPSYIFVAIGFIYYLFSYEWIHISLAVSMLILIIGTLIYVILLVVLSSIFSMSIIGTLSSSSSDNYECGFYSIMSSSLKYRFNYWLIVLHFVLFEQELFIALMIIYGIHSLSSIILILLLLILLFIDLFIL
jgi:NADH:ubiquinone oxidoreductase subunit 3 (subunit A)